MIQAASLVNPYLARPAASAAPRAQQPAEAAPPADTFVASAASAPARPWTRLAAGVGLALALGTGLAVPASAAPPAAAVSQSQAWTPRVCVGAPTVSLDVGHPGAVYRPSPVAIEIADGVGLGLDGHTLVVCDNAAAGTRINGRLADGTMPQRDFVVTKDGDTTRVDGYFSRQSYTLTRTDGGLQIGNEDPEFSSTVNVTADGVRVDGPKEAQRYEIFKSGNDIVVQGFERTTIRFRGDTVRISNPERELSYDLTRTPDGVHIEGAHRFQSFDVRYTPGGFTIDGAYPVQHVEVTRPQ